MKDEWTQKLEHGYTAEHTLSNVHAVLQAWLHGHNLFCGHYPYTDEKWRVGHNDGTVLAEFDDMDDALDFCLNYLDSHALQ